METKIFKGKVNSGVLEQNKEQVILKYGRYIDKKDSLSFPLKFKRMYCFKQKYVYFIYLYGDKENTGFHISLSFWQNQRFLFLQRKHWLQKEENIRYLINILFLIVGIVITLKN
jgi:hypothetical protein